MPRLDITLEGHLLIAGGQAAALGVDLSTTRRLERGRWIPYLPATAVRGAVRIQLEALARGLGKPATEPYPFEEEDAEAPPADPVSRLFGYSGPEGSRSGSQQGQLRFSDALPVDADLAVAAIRVRTGVEIDDATASVEEHKLYSRELVDLAGEPLVFRSWLAIGDGVSEDDRELLAQAVKTTFAIGGGKSSGGGEVTIDWADEDEPSETVVEGDAAGAGRARLTLKLLEPAHFGDGGPRGNHHGTKTWIPGSTVRGAVAWALLERTETEPEDAGFQDLFVGPAAAGFGDALASSGDGDPAVVPATLRERREKGGGFEDVLARELARADLNPLLTERGLYLRGDVRDLRPDPLPPRPAPDLLRRVRTRVAIDRRTGTSADGKLFSIEQIEPWTAAEKPEDSRRVTFVSRVEGLTRAAAAVLARLADVPVYVGAGRHHGMGKVTAEVRFESDPELDLEQELARVDRLDAAVRAHRRALAKRCGLERDEATGFSDGSVVLALVAQSVYLPSGDGEHPLAAWPSLAGEPIRRFVTHGHSGGYNQMPDDGERPLKTLRTAVGAGSVYVYRVERAVLGDLLSQALPRLHQGVGARQELGCGRFDLFEEITR